jgi:hypothetical protein
MIKEQRKKAGLGASSQRQQQRTEPGEYAQTHAHTCTHIEEEHVVAIVVIVARLLPQRVVVDERRDDLVGSGRSSNEQRRGTLARAHVDASMCMCVCVDIHIYVYMYIYMCVSFGGCVIFANI